MSKYVIKNSVTGKRGNVEINNSPQAGFTITIVGHDWFSRISM